MKVDKVSSPRVTQSGNPASSPPPIIRAMANTLCDHGIDPLDEVAAGVTLIRAGFPAKLIEHCFDEVIAMTMMRVANEQRKRRRA